MTSPQETKNQKGGYNRGYKKGVQFPMEGVQSKGDVYAELSEDQAHVLYMLTQEYLTPKKIAIRRKTTVWAVYNIIKKLKKKGAITRGYNRGVQKSVPTRLKSPNYTSTSDASNGKPFIRLHGQEWHIKILDKGTIYEQLRAKGNTIQLDGNTVRLYTDSIEVYCAEDRDFRHHDVQRVTALSFQYWNRFFVRLENQLKVIILKARSHNIILVKQHYSEVQN